jgi:hypothetical protein
VNAEGEKKKRPRKVKKFLLVWPEGNGQEATMEIDGENDAFAEYARRAANGDAVQCYQVEKVELLLSARRA